MPSRPANVSLTYRRCPGPSAAPAREEIHPTEPSPLTSCSMSDPGRLQRCDVEERIHAQSEVHGLVRRRHAGLGIDPATAPIAVAERSRPPARCPRDGADLPAVGATERECRPRSLDAVAALVEKAMMMAAQLHQVVQARRP